MRTADAPAAPCVRHRARGVLLAVLAHATSACATNVRPLEATIEPGFAIVSGEELGDPTGIGGRLALHWLVLSASSGGATTTRVDVPCGGFIDDPDPCYEQPIAQRSSLTRFSAGYLSTRQLPGRTRLVVVPHAGMAWFEHDEVGIWSGAKRSAEGGGLDLGAVVGVRYNLFDGVWLGADVDAALILPWSPECVDCYDPFRDETFWLARFALTASMRVP